MALGLSFMPSSRPTGGTRAPGAPRPQLQEAIKILSLRLPKTTGPAGVAPAPLLTSPGGAGASFPNSAVAQTQQLPPGALPSPTMAPTMGPQVSGAPGPGQPGQDQIAAVLQQLSTRQPTPEAAPGAGPSAAPPPSMPMVHIGAMTTPGSDAPDHFTAPAGTRTTGGPTSYYDLIRQGTPGPGATPMGSGPVAPEQMPIAVGDRTTGGPAAPLTFAAQRVAQRNRDPQVQALLQALMRGG